MARRSATPGPSSWRCSMSRAFRLGLTRVMQTSTPRCCALSVLAGWGSVSSLAFSCGVSRPGISRTSFSARLCLCWTNGHRRRLRKAGRQPLRLCARWRGMLSARPADRGSWSWAEELLAVAAAEQEDEPLQVATQFAQAVGGVADELAQAGGQAVRVAGQPFAEELQHLRE